MFTHEQFVERVYKAVMAQALDDKDKAALQRIKLVYGAGQAGLRGVTYYNRWGGKDDGQAMPFVEVCAFGQESIVQLAGTTVHELGHVAAGWEAGHGKDWVSACARLGLNGVRAVGTDYQWSMFDPKLRRKLEKLPMPDDGKPVALAGMPIPGRSGNRMVAPKPCGAGIGTKGGKSRGAGSGSRLRLYECECTPKPVKARVAGFEFNATCNCCSGLFRFVK